MLQFLFYIVRTSSGCNYQNRWCLSHFVWKREKSRIISSDYRDALFADGCLKEYKIEQSWNQSPRRQHHLMWMQNRVYFPPLEMLLWLYFTTMNRVSRSRIWPSIINIRVQKVRISKKNVICPNVTRITARHAENRAKELTPSSLLSYLQCINSSYSSYLQNQKQQLIYYIINIGGTYKLVTQHYNFLN